MSKILLLRFSDMGEVAMLVPAVRSVTAAYPEVEITVVTRPRFASYFFGIERVKIFEADIDAHFIGFFGLRKLFMALLARADYDVVIDLHANLRTIILTRLFRVFGLRVVTFTKGTREMKRFTRKNQKITQPLPHLLGRYRAALEAAGFPAPLLPGPYLIPREVSRQNLQKWLTKLGLAKNQPWIGLAPFAAHPTVMWPLENYAKLMEQVIAVKNVRFFLFGNGEAEVRQCEALQQRFPSHCTVAAGQLKVQQELALLQLLDLMVCPDSSALHLASLSGTHVLSIWGGTHPDVGFGAAGMSAEHVIQIDRSELECRPCSVHGKARCFRGDFACLTRITPAQVGATILARFEN
jgi:ADP-heptose:LPS heptosyltransferase